MCEIALTLMYLQGFLLPFQSFTVEPLYRIDIRQLIIAKGFYVCRSLYGMVHSYYLHEILYGFRVVIQCAIHATRTIIYIRQHSIITISFIMVNECQDFFIIFKIRVFFHLKFERKKLQKPSAILIIGFLTLLGCNKQCFCPLYILTTQCVYMGKLTRCSVPLMNKKQRHSYDHQSYNQEGD